jgi:diguanylate cyclase (GGDEF)-like protein
MRAAVEAARVQSASLDLGVTISLGVASSATAGFDPPMLVQAADEALYRAKARGRNCVESA